MQNVKTKRYEMDMTSGNLFKKIVRFSIPLMLTGILQLLYNPYMKYEIHSRI